MSISFDYPTTIVEARRKRRGSSTLKILHPEAEFLQGMDGNVTSQCGEDGLIAAVFAQIGIKNRWCFEVGAGDGVFLSNTWVLRRHGWTAVLIEADFLLYQRLLEFAGWRAGGNVHVRHERIDPTSLDMILASVSAPKDLDLGVIDIDGEDLHIWAGLKLYRPRVVLIEFNAGGDGILGGVGVWQAGLESIAALGKAKGYRLLAQTGHNALFVDEGEL